MADSANILLVEDNKITQCIIQSFLENLGCIVDVAGNGLEALAYLKNKYQMILLDIGLPDMDGFKIIEKIQSTVNANQHTPIIMHTTHYSPYFLSKGKKLGVDKVIEKPVSLDTLFHLLQGYDFFNNRQQVLR